MERSSLTPDEKAQIDAMPCKEMIMLSRSGKITRQSPIGNQLDYFNKILTMKKMALSTSQRIQITREVNEELAI